MHSKGGCGSCKLIPCFWVSIPVCQQSRDESRCISAALEAFGRGVGVGWGVLGVQEPGAHSLGFSCTLLVLQPLKMQLFNCSRALFVLAEACCVRVQPGLVIISNLSKQQSYFSFSNSFSGASWDVRLCSGCCCSKDTTACSLKQSFLFLLELSSLFLCTFGGNSLSFS